jgi:hypothetical protein
MRACNGMFIDVLHACVRERALVENDTLVQTEHYVFTQRVPVQTQQRHVKRRIKDF